MEHLYHGCIVVFIRPPQVSLAVRVERMATLMEGPFVPEGEVRPEKVGGMAVARLGDQGGLLEIRNGQAADNEREEFVG